MKFSIPYDNRILTFTRLSMTSKRFCLALLVSCTLPLSFVAAENTVTQAPASDSSEQTESVSKDAAAAKALVESITSKMKKAASPAPMLEFVHWPSVMKKLAESGHLKKANISSAEELKSFYQTFFTNPESFLRDQMHKRMEQMPAEQQEVVKARIDSLVKQLGAKMRKSREQLADTTFEIGAASVDGDTATVPLKIIKPSKDIQTELVELRRFDGKWFLPSMIGEGKEATPPSAN